MTPDAVLRFESDVAQVLARAPADVRDAPLGLAISGGPDSMAMLALAHAAFPTRIAAATVDHRLRPGSEADARMVAETCAALGIAHVTFVPPAPIVGSSLQARARGARYDLLLNWARDIGAGALLTAHQADDQAETLLMRLNRASGVTGLAGIRACRVQRGVAILRPLLGWRRAELRAIALARGLPFVDDPANADPRHDRTRVRALLASVPALDAASLARSAAYLAEAEEVLGALADRLWGERWRGTHEPFAVADEPRELRRRLLRRAVCAVRERHAITRPGFGDSAGVEPLLDALEQGRTATRGGVKVAATPAGWSFSPALPHRSL